jgi:4-aminobutyrate--pyruvate transaminase
LKPDILCAAKALSSGYVPISAVMINEKVASAVAANSGKIGTFGHGFTYSGHPVTSAVALETLKVYEDEDVLAHVKSIAPAFQAGLQSFAKRKYVGEVRGVGLIGAIELVADPATRMPFDPSVKAGIKLAEAALEQGLIVRAMGDAVAFCPPLIITTDEMADMFARFDRAMTRFEEMQS